MHDIRNDVTGQPIAMMLGMEERLKDSFIEE